jgi:uncharacterized protein DUF6115
MEAISIKYWVVFQMVLDLFLVMLVLFFIKSMKSGLRKEATREAAQQVIQLIEPLLKEAEKTADTFDRQLKEKSRLIYSINERLDSRIISLNLLLNRAKTDFSSVQGEDGTTQSHIYDQQEAILALYKENHDPETIARKLSMPRGEVDLVIDLKQKFQSIE